MRPVAAKSPSPEKARARQFSATEIYALLFGLFLGLALLKFGNPTILDRVITAPASWADAWSDWWPLSWANVCLAVLALPGVLLAIVKKPRWPCSRWLWILPLVWFAWQLLSATQTVRADLTADTLWQFGGCVACYFLGALVIGNGRGWRWVMAGLFVALAFCLVRAVDQKLFEFPREREFLLSSQRMGWTNMPPGMFQELQRDHVIIHTNSLDIANPAIIAKYEKGRVHSTLVYPNALAGAILLLWPMAIVSVLEVARRLRRVTGLAAIALVVALGAAGLVFSGSKGGWLIALALGVVWLCRINWPRRFKWLMVVVVVAGGLLVFGLRFQTYFAKGATSVGARFDYWRVAVRVTLQHPLLGSGPGTFQKPYFELKKPDAEMARLVHNDYLEQFSDSGFVAGLAYAAWIALMLWTIGRRAWRRNAETREAAAASARVPCHWLEFAVFVGLLGWFVQGLMEFSLYVPALAWTAFTLAGCLLRTTRHPTNQLAQRIMSASQMEFCLNSVSPENALIRTYCKNACNDDPLRGGFRVQ